jgi:hypothetical protein
MMVSVQSSTRESSELEVVLCVSVVGANVVLGSGIVELGSRLPNMTSWKTISSRQILQFILKTHLGDYQIELSLREPKLRTQKALEYTL